MNLVLDIGNTRVKYGVFDHKILLSHGVIEAKNLSTGLEGLIKKYPQCTRALLCQVGPTPEADLIAIKRKMEVIFMSADLSFPVKNNYQSPNTLGFDRLALASAARVQYPDKAVLVIDCGTCVTYDFIEANGAYNGGAISPGLSMRYKAMNAYTKALPELKAEVPSGWYGATTETSMHHGAFFGLVHEINGFVNQYRRYNADLTTILTGGDLEILRDHIKNDIFAHPNFLLLGLNEILLIN
jgi:type III pantothenate kinase